MLRQSEAETQAILQAAVDAIITIDELGVVQTFNPAAERVFGYKAAEVVGQNLAMLMPEPTRSQHPSHLRRYLQTGEPHVIGSGARDHGHQARRHADPRWNCPSAKCASAIAGFLPAFSATSRPRKQLEKQILEVSGREQRRIGQDLHDGLGQLLTGISFMSQGLSQRLADKSLPEAAEARQIAQLVSQAITQAKALARGLSPVESQGLESALDELAKATSDLFHVRCTLSCRGDVASVDPSTATHLYRIAQEAVHNAIRHGQAQQIKIALVRGRGSLSLSVEDDGRGLPEVVPDNKGLGTRIMNYRAQMIGATLELRNRPGAGAVVRCDLPVSQPNTSQQEH